MIKSVNENYSTLVNNLITLSYRIQNKNKNLHLLRAVNLLMRTGMGHTAVSAT